MTTPAQLIAAARLVDKGWFQGHYQKDKNCPLTAVHAVCGDMWIDLERFEPDLITHNDAPDCTKDGAVLFLLACAEARRCEDL